MACIVLTMTLLGCSFPTLAMVQLGTETGTNYTMEYPLVYVESAAAQTAINEDLTLYLDAFRDAMEHGVEHPGLVSGKRIHFKSGRLLTQVTCEDETLVSLRLTDSRNTDAAHAMYTLRCFTYDKLTGQRIHLSDYVPLTAADLNEALADHLYSGNFNKKITYTGKDPAPIKTVPDNFYILPDGGIAVQFQPYALASYTEGATTIPFYKRRSHSHSPGQASYVTEFSSMFGICYNVFRTFLFRTNVCQQQNLFVEHTFEIHEYIH
jgi:hypothetical protein